MLTQAQKLLILRETSMQKARELRMEQPFTLKQSVCQRQGRANILEEVVAAFARLTMEMESKQVQLVVQTLLAKLAERKAADLAFLLRNRMRYGIDQFDAWIAEGEIQQIDAMWTQICACCSRQWQVQPWKHGCFFHVYHSLDERSFGNAEARARWQSEKRALWFWEAAIIEVTPTRTVEQRLEEVFRLTNHIEENWTQGQAIFWVQRGMPVRSTSRGDVIASVLSGNAWMVASVGFQPLQ